MEEVTISLETAKIALLALSQANAADGKTKLALANAVVELETKLTGK